MRIVVATFVLSALAACTAPARSAPQEGADAHAPRAVIVQSAGGKAVGRDGTVATSIPLEHAQAESVVHDLRELMNGWTQCRFVANEASNTIVVVGPADEIETLRDVIANLDTPQRPGAGAR